MNVTTSVVACAPTIPANTIEIAPPAASSHSPLTSGPFTAARSVYAPPSSSAPVTSAHATMKYANHMCAAAGKNSVRKPMAPPTTPSRKSDNQLVARPAPIVKMASASAKRSEEHTSELQSHSDLVC